MITWICVYPTSTGILMMVSVITEEITLVTIHAHHTKSVYHQSSYYLVTRLLINISSYILSYDITCK